MRVPCFLEEPVVSCRISLELHCCPLGLLLCCCGAPRHRNLGLLFATIRLMSCQRALGLLWLHIKWIRTARLQNSAVLHGANCLSMPTISIRAKRSGCEEKILILKGAARACQNRPRRVSYAQAPAKRIERPVQQLWRASPPCATGPEPKEKATSLTRSE